MNLMCVPEDIILYILKHISNDKDAASFISSCKYLSRIGKEYGYLKHITLNWNLPNKKLNYFYTQCSIHEKSLISLKIENIDDPASWIPFNWPKIVYFNNCTFFDSINPSDICVDTEELHFEYGRSKTQKINVNWKQFPNLKKLHMKLTKINLSNIRDCKHLKLFNNAI